MIPYVFDGANSVAHVSTMRENTFWLELIPQKESSFTYVRNLVRDKLAEFTQAYARLFSAGGGVGDGGYRGSRGDHLRV